VRRGPRLAEQVDELRQRLLHAGANPATEVAAHRAVVLGHRARNRGEDLIGQRRQAGAQDVTEPRR
jgi:hypothetical protein